jgi:hypothetical protein
LPWKGFWKRIRRFREAVQKPVAAGAACLATVAGATSLRWISPAWPENTSAQESEAVLPEQNQVTGRNFTVEASIGHVRDLPQGAAQIPAEFKGEPWSNLGVNVNDNFTPIYIIPPGKSKQIKLLKDRLKQADALD